MLFFITGDLQARDEGFDVAFNLFVCSSEFRKEIEGALLKIDTTVGPG
ncbi:MAG: hypothetical protein R3C68_12380 [Myxococcota bacterium]